MENYAEAGWNVNFNSKHFAEKLSPEEYKNFLTAWKELQKDPRGVMSGGYHAWQNAYKAAVASGTLDKCKGIFELLKHS